VSSVVALKERDMSIGLTASRSPPIVLQWCYSGVTVVLCWDYSGVTVALQWRHGEGEGHVHRVDSKSQTTFQKLISFCSQIFEKHF
jgi:hypothetical protein